MNKERKEELQEGVDSKRITKDDLGMRIAAIDKIRAILKMDTDVQNSALKAPNGDIERCRLVLSMLKKLEDGLNAVRRSFENTMMFL